MDTILLLFEWHAKDWYLRYINDKGWFKVENPRINALQALWNHLKYDFRQRLYPHENFRQEDGEPIGACWGYFMSLVFCGTR